MQVDDIARLDAFEGAEYRREKITAKIGADEMPNVETYIYTGAADLLSRPWLPEAFQVQLFLDTYCTPQADK